MGWSQLRGRWRVLIVVASVLVLAIVGTTAWVLTAGRESSEVTEAEALEQAGESGPGESPGDGVPAPGVYTYRQDGWERVGAGPLAVRRELPKRARIAIADGGASDYEATAFLSGEHVEGVRYRRDGEWIREVWRRTDVTLVGIGRDDRRDLVPPPRRVPVRPEPGTSWTDEYRAGSLPVEASSRIVRRDALALGGRTVPVVVLDVRSTTGGVHPGTRVETVWWSPEHAVPVRWRLEMDVEGVAKLTTRTALELTDLEPATSAPS